MAGLFKPSSDRALRYALLTIALFVVSLVALPMLYVRTPSAQAMLRSVDQPIPFDHRHHVRDDGIACLYCHLDAERSPHAGVPSSDVCMGCHAQIWRGSPTLAVLRTSFAADQPLRWQRVYDVPDFVQFDHSVHVSAGVACERCHGDIASLPQVTKLQDLRMQTCLECHRAAASAASAAHARRGASHPQASDGFVGDTLMSCTACHR